MGTILRYDGTTWSKITPIGYAANLYAIGGDKSTVYIVGNANVAGNSLKSTAPFDTFTLQSTGSNDLTAVVIGSNGIGWASGRQGYLGYFDTRP